MKIKDVVRAQEVQFTDILSLLKKGPKTAEELADALDCSPRRIREQIETQRARGALILDTVDGRYDLGSGLTIEPQKHEIAGEGSGRFRFGFVTDNHLCNKHSRLDVLSAAYDRFEREGIATVYNAGNWIDGEARFNKTELIVRPGMDAQLDYMIDVYPQRKGVTTHYIAGDDHEGWYQQREGIEIGRYLQYRAEEQGRHDLKYLGYAEADIQLNYGSGHSVGRLVHPGGGSAYAISYKAQKRVESYQGGEKPHFEMAGHYHKFNLGYPREVWTADGGCTCDQTMFMRKKGLQAHVGYSIVNIALDMCGAIEEFSQQFFPSYDRKYYEQRF